MPRKAPKTTIRYLRSEPDFAMLFPLVRQLNPDLTHADFARYLKEMLSAGYRCVGLYRGEKLIGACGIWTSTRFWCGTYMEVDNVVIDQGQRNAGLGKLLMAWVEKEAKKLGCRLVIADSYTYNHASHRFYMRGKYIIKGFVFVKEIGNR